MHISELSWGRVDHPSDALQVGQEVEVYVLNVDRERGRGAEREASCSRIRGCRAEERYQVGQVVDGLVTRVMGFGAFVRVEAGLEGLIHVWTAEAGAPYARLPLSEGYRVSVRVMNVDGRQRRMGLSLRRNAEPTVDDMGWPS